MTRGLLGYSPERLAHYPYAWFYNSVIGPLQPQVAEALLIGPQADELFPTVDAAGSLIEPGYWPVETGYSRPPASAESRHSALAN